MLYLTEFASLFNGYEKAFGKFLINNINENVKKSGIAKTLARSIEKKDWLDHLQGREGLGVIPIRHDNTVFFAAIDIDDYSLNIPDLLDKVKELPVVPCRSKSGGLHLYFFFLEPTPARLVVEELRSVVIRLNIKAEIFPKQTYRYNEKDIGNWINLPYFNAEETGRYALSIKGEKLDLKQFIEYAATQKTTIENLRSALNKHTSAESKFFEAPPCLQHLYATGGFPEGSRNNGLVNLSIYLKKRFPESYEEKLRDYSKLMYPNNLDAWNKIPIKEFNTVLNSVKKADYNYMCKEAPICNYCDREKCKTRKFGISTKNVIDSEEFKVTINSITKLEGDPIMWALNIDNERIMCSTEQLYSQGDFRKLCLERLHKLPAFLSRAAWEDMINQKLTTVEVIMPPEEVTEGYQLRELIVKFCTGGVQAKSWEEIAQGKPYRENGSFYFNPIDLERYLNLYKFKYESRRKLWFMFEAIGGTGLRKRVKGTHDRRLWVFSDYVESSNDVPF